MPFKRHTPQHIHPPFANYVHGVEVPPNARLMVCSGQLGIAKDGTIPQGAEAQTALAFRNVEAILSSGDMSLADIVRINAYVTDRAHLPGYMAARDNVISAPPPASTLMIVSGFARPEFVVEIEVIAAKTP